MDAKNFAISLRDPDPDDALEGGDLPHRSPGATAMTEFVRPAFEQDGQLRRVGRQSQTWVRTDAGWKIASAHVSFGM